MTELVDGRCHLDSIELRGHQTKMAAVIRTTQRRWSASAWLSLFAAAMVMLPIASVVFELRHPADEVWLHVAGTLLPRYVWNSVTLAVGVGICTISIGVGAAFILTHAEFAGRRLLQWMLVLPVAFPPYVTAYVYYEFLSVAGPLQSSLRQWTGLSARELDLPSIASLPGAIFVLSISLYPYVYLAAWSSFAQQGARLVETARSLGCSKFEAFRRVSLPLARPAIIAGSALVLMETMAEFGALSILGVQTLTTGIFKAWFGMGDRVAAAQLAAMLLAVVALLLWLERAQRRGRIHDSRHRREADDRQLDPRVALIAAVLCLLPLLAGFILPVTYLLWLAFDVGFYLTPGTLTALGNTIFVAASSAAIAVLLSLAMIYGARLAPLPLVRMANGMAGLGYAVPGPVLAIGALIPLAAIDRIAGGIVAEWFGTKPQLWLSGSLVILIYVYLVRFMTISLGGIEAGFLKVKPSMDEAAVVLGYGAVRRLFAVHARLILPAVVVAGTLVFVDVAKELPATLILRPFDFDTLAVDVFNLARDERLAQAATPALILVLVGLLPAWLMSRTMRR